MAMLVALAVAMALALWWIHRQAELAFISRRGGRMLLVRGALPPGLLRDLEQALAREGDGWLQLQRTRDTPALRSKGLSEGGAQRARNLIALRRPTEFRSALPPRERTLGQKLGWSWLAWRQQRKHGGARR